MLRFFRQIRKSLMEQNNFRSYLLYAIGEIALVMIGILLALQVNNWNEQAKLKVEEKATLQNLLNDLQSNKVQLEDKILDAEDQIKNVKKVLNINPQNIYVSDYQLDSLYAEISSPPTFDPNEANIKEIINSGKINLISNDALKLSILQWEGTMQEVRELQDVITVTNRVELEMISEYLTLRNFYKVPLGESNFKSNSTELLKSKKNENYLTIKYRRLIVLLERYAKMDNLISSMIIDINTERN